MTSPHEQKLKIKGPVVVTANRLHRRCRDLSHRRRRLDHRSRRRRRGDDARRPRRNCSRRAIADDVGAVGPYVAPVELTPDQRVLPGNLRERIRLAGPTIELPALRPA